MDAQTLNSLGTTLVFIGMLITAIALALILLSKVKKTGKARGGGAVLIGPVPIVFGTDKQSLKIVLLLSIILTILLIALTVLSRLLSG